jgi:signal peptidase complex subunit 3
MHTAYARVNNVTAFLSSCVMALLAAIALSSFVFTAAPKGEISVSQMQM